MSSVNTGTFTPLFSTWMSFFTFIALLSGLDPSGQRWSESVWAEVTFLDALYQVEEIPLDSLFTENFLKIRTGVAFYQTGSLHISRLLCDIPCFVCWYDELHWLTFTCYTITHKPYSVMRFHSPGRKRCSLPRVCSCCHCLGHVLWLEFSWTPRGPCSPFPAHSVLRLQSPGPPWAFRECLVPSPHIPASPRLEGGCWGCWPGPEDHCSVSMLRVQLQVHLFLVSPSSQERG